MVTALTASLVAGCGSNGDSKDKSSGSDRETKDVSELVIGEIEYSVIDDGGWAQSMHEGLKSLWGSWNRYKDKSSDNGRKSQEEDTSWSGLQWKNVDEGADIIFRMFCGIFGNQSFSRNTRMLSSHNRVTMFMISLSSRSVDMRRFPDRLLISTDGWRGSNQLGFCASMDEASVRTAINAYALGAKYAKSGCQSSGTLGWQLVWSWCTQNAKTLIDNGIKYIEWKLLHLLFRRPVKRMVHSVSVIT